jgi:hypothetical protein
MIENIKARIRAKRYDIYKEEIVKRGNNGYFIYNNKIYYGNRFLVFFYSNQNNILTNNKTKTNE